MERFGTLGVQNGGTLLNVSTRVAFRDASDTEVDWSWGCDCDRMMRRFFRMRLWRRIAAARIAGVGESESEVDGVGG